MINIVSSRYAEALFQVGEESNSTEKLYDEEFNKQYIWKTNR